MSDCLPTAVILGFIYLIGNRYALCVKFGSDHVLLLLLGSYSIEQPVMHIYIFFCRDVVFVTSWERLFLVKHPSVIRSFIIRVHQAVDVFRISEL